MAGWMTPLVAGVVALGVVGLAEETKALARLFGDPLNGLPLDAMHRTLDIKSASRQGVDTAAPMALRMWQLR